RRRRRLLLQAIPSRSCEHPDGPNRRKQPRRESYRTEWVQEVSIFEDEKGGSCKAMHKQHKPKRGREFRLARLVRHSYTYFFHALGCASVAQRQSTGFVNQWLWVQVPPLASLGGESRQSWRAGRRRPRAIDPRKAPPAKQLSLRTRQRSRS